MSEALRELVERFFRARKKGAEIGEGDGVALSKRQVDAALACLSDIERAEIEEDAVRLLLPELEREQKPPRGGRLFRPQVEPAKSAMFARVKKLDAAARGRVLTTWAIVLGLTNASEFFDWNDRTSRTGSWIRDVTAALGKLSHALTLSQVRAIIQANVNRDQDDEGPNAARFGYATIELALGGIERNRAEWTFDDEDRRVFADVVTSLQRFASNAKTRRHIAMLKEIVAGGASCDVLRPGEVWAAAINAALAATEPAADRDRWTRLLSFASTGNQSKPSRQWMGEARAMLDAMPADATAVQLVGWLRAFVAAPRPPGPPEPRPWTQAGWEAWRASRAEQTINTGAMVGLVWLAQARPHARFAAVLADVAEAIARWPQVARDESAPVALAAVRVLGAADDEASLAQLARLEMRVRWPKLKEEVKKQFDAAAARRGGDRAELAESLVPDFGLADGVATIDLGDRASARLTLGRADKPSVEWHSTDGKASRVMPRALKPHAATVKQAVEDIERMRAAQRTRLDLLLRRQRAWPVDVWRARYLDHGLVGTLARRLVWARRRLRRDVARRRARRRDRRDDRRADGRDGPPLAPRAALDGRSARVARRARAVGGHAAVQTGAPRDIPAHRRGAADEHVQQPLRRAHRPRADVARGLAGAAVEDGRVRRRVVAERRAAGRRPARRVVDGAGRRRSHAVRRAALPRDGSGPLRRPRDERGRCRSSACRRSS